jgi:pimeloyl-ACP methyl ester carboxylesterase
MNANLHYSEDGATSGPILLLIHPMGADHSFWNGCRAIWEDTYRCVAMDLPNAGASHRTAAPLSMEEQAAELEAFRQALRLERVIPVGCAVGAIIATVYAGMFPDNCDALVISNPGFRTKPEAKAMLAKRAEDVRAGGMAAVLSTVVDGSFLGCPEDRPREDFRKRLASQNPEAYALQIEGMLDADTEPYLPNITFPTLIVAGGNDRLLPPDHARQIHESLAASEFKLIEDGAHFIPYQRPAEFAGLVDHFLERLSLGGA